jgi:3-oxoacyl-(acyl-carrier-protein) synthase
LRIHIIGLGLVSALGTGMHSHCEALLDNRSGIGPLTLFPTGARDSLPVGETPIPVEADGLPRTHHLACLAAAQAMANVSDAPDAVVVGVTTGGMPSTEALLRKKVEDPALYQGHATGSVAATLARIYDCRGPVLTVSTACSSGAAALKLALELIRSGSAQRVLAGGADALCRLTYHGFKALQLIDPDGARPLDVDRRGMSVGEGAGMLLLSANEPDRAMAELLGAGLSCDAYHPAAPHPEGAGALAAMRAALKDAGLTPADIDVVNLHGTGTRDNDAAEAKAVTALFGRDLPLHASIKGATGHSLAAAGAIEAAISTISISKGVIPANSGCRQSDPDLALTPLLAPVQQQVDAVLSNSFGFGGNNASLVMGSPGRHPAPETRADPRTLRVTGHACITGAGRTRATMHAVGHGKTCAGVLDSGEIAANLSPARIRRLKRLPRLALALAEGASASTGDDQTPEAVFMGTGWGALSETSDFLEQLFATDEQFASPTDFVGSVHNAAAGQVAMQYDARGANLTMTGGDYSFEQALLAAELTAGDCRNSLLVVGADEHHERLSPLFDGSAAQTLDCPADGGGALFIDTSGPAKAPRIQTRFFQYCGKEEDSRPVLGPVKEGLPVFENRYAVIMAGLPAACRRKAEKQLKRLLEMSGFKGVVVDYRKYTGEFASASAVAAVMAVEMLMSGRIPASLGRGTETVLGAKGILVAGFGDCMTAIEVMNP